MDENHTIKPSKQEITKSINQIFQKYERQREAKRASRKRARLASANLENSRNNQHQIYNTLQSYSFNETSKNDIPLKYRSHNDDALPYKPLQDQNESLQQHLSRSRTSSQESIQGIKSPAYSLMKQNSQSSPTKSLLSLKNSKNQVCSVEIGQTYSAFISIVPVLIKSAYIFFRYF